MILFIFDNYKFILKFINFLFIWTKFNSRKFIIELKSVQIGLGWSNFRAFMCDPTLIGEGKETFLITM